jgi:hypothetical protein
MFRIAYIIMLCLLLVSLVACARTNESPDAVVQAGGVISHNLVKLAGANPLVFNTTAFTNPTIFPIVHAWEKYPSPYNDTVRLHNWSEVFIPLPPAFQGYQAHNLVW